MTGGALVLKFGGESLATPGRLRLAARRVRAHRRSGRRPVAVASAMGRTTDRIVERIRGAAPGDGAGAAPREADRALATGEEQAAALLALALSDTGLEAVSLRGGEAGLRAEGPHGKGRIAHVDVSRLRGLLDDGLVPVVCGFQAARPDGETVTLGRDSSDLTAVALAAELGAGCHLVTDVEGVHRRDPGDAGAGEPLGRLDHDELLRIVEAGAEVVHPAAARLARDRRVPLLVYSFRCPRPGGGGTRVEPSGRRGPEDAGGDAGPRSGGGAASGSAGPRRAGGVAG